VLAGQKLGNKEVTDNIWLASFMDYDLGCFGLATCRPKPIENPFEPKALPVSPERTNTPWRRECPPIANAN
jgi:putative transposase